MECSGNYTNTYMVRFLFPALWCTVALAQLPKPQAATPPGESSVKSRKHQASAGGVLQVDAVVTDAQGRAVRNLTAPDFEVLTDDKPRKVTDCRFESDEPLRIALVVDDLSLSREHLAAIKSALLRFVNGPMQTGEKAAILRTGSGESALEQFTSDRPALAAAAGRLVYNPAQADASPHVFTTGSLGALRAILEGLRYVPGRKLVVLFSERLRETAHSNQPKLITGLFSAANRGSAVVYALDAGPAGAPLHMDQGIAELANDTGGAFFDAVTDFSAALGRIVQEQTGYYAIHFAASPFEPVYPVAVRTPGKDLRVRARRGAMGLAGDEGITGYVTPGTELATALYTETAGAGAHVRMTVAPGRDEKPYLNVGLHVDGHDLTFTRGLDGAYRSTLEVAAGLFQEGASPAGQTSRMLSIRLGEKAYRDLLETGFDYTLRMAAPRKGAYQIRAAVLNVASDQTGSASQFFEAPDFASGLGISAIVLRAEPAGQAARDATLFHPGQRIRYVCELFNLDHNAQNHSIVEVVVQLLRDGTVVYTSKPQLVNIEIATGTRRRGAGGIIRLASDFPPGTYQLRITVTDTLAPAGAARTATQSAHLQVAR
jgi:VWFA-related protein